MKFYYNLLENPRVYNWNMKIASFNNKTLLGYIDRLIDAQNEDRILDVGCGTGKFAIFKKGYYLGVDSNEKYIDYAGKHYKKEFLIMDATDMNLEDESFNKVFCMSSLHHVSDKDAERMLQEMERVCKKNGYIYIIDAVYPKNFLGHLLFKFDRGRYQRTFEELKNLLLKYNFNIITDNVGKTYPYQWAIFSYIKK